MAIAGIHRFASVAEFIETCQKDIVKGWEWTSYGDPTWNGIAYEKQAGPEACKLALEGDPNLKASTSEAMSRLVPQYVEGSTRRWAPSIAGSRVCIPEYLSGNPMCMRRRVPRESITRHMNVYVAVGCQAAVRAGQMVERGAIVLGMLEALQAAQVGVDLYLVHELADDQNDRFFIVKVDSQPLNLSEASFAIAHPAFFRVLGMQLAAAYGDYRGQFSAKAQGNKGSSTWCDWVRAKLDIAPSDVYVPYAHPRFNTVEPSDVARAIQQHIEGAVGT